MPYEIDIFTSFIEKANNIYNYQANNLRIYIKQQRKLGFTVKEIFDKINYDYKHNTGVYRDYTGQLEKEITAAINLTFNSEANDYKDDGLYVWELDPAAEHCDSCMYQASRGALPIDRFPIPGTQETRGTNCESYCKCTLIKT